MRRAACWLAAGVCLLGASSRAAALTADGAVALALRLNREVIAAKLEIDAAELDVVAARIYPNPVLQYGASNLVVGTANNQNGAVTQPPGFFGQTVQTLGISEVLDVWAKRSARARAAKEGALHRRLLTEDAIREIAYAVRSAFGDVMRAQAERDLAREVTGRYAETVRLSQARFKAGDISEAELRKIELEGMRYQNDVVDADARVDLAVQELAARVGLPSVAEIAGGPFDAPDRRPAFDLRQLTETAFRLRPDLRAAGAARTQAEAQLAAARREIYPDPVLGVGYTHSDFTVAGDNPDTLALGVSLPLPIFDRNQAGIGRARLDIQRADNDTERLRIQVAREVAEAVRKANRAQTLLASFETKPGMIKQAETALAVAEKSYKSGAVSLLDLLEAQRTYLAIRAQYLQALHDFRQAAVDVTHAVGE